MKSVVYGGGRKFTARARLHAGMRSYFFDPRWGTHLLRLAQELEWDADISIASTWACIYGSKQAAGMLLSSLGWVSGKKGKQ